MSTIIGFEAKRANANRTGLGNYSRFVIRSLKRAGIGDRLNLYIPKRKANAEYDALLEMDGVTSHLPDRPVWRRLSALWRVFGVAQQLQRDGVKLFHGLSNELPCGLGRRGIRSVVTVHDLIFRILPGCYKPVDRWIYTWKFRSACRRADRIVAVSECTKRDIVRLFGIDPAKIEVIYQGCDEMFAERRSAAELDRAAREYGLPERYLLNVGTLEERKNLLEVVQALEHLPAEIHLVAVGGRTAYTARVERYAAEHGLTDRIHLLHKVTYRDLPLLYARAEVMVATGSCLEEAGGPDQLYVSPDDPAELARAVSRILDDPELRRTLAERGRAYVERFRMEVVGPQMADLYGRLSE